MILEKIVETGMVSLDNSRNIRPEMISFAETLVAEEFAEAINSGRLSVEDAYNNFWSYEEDSKLWNLAGDKRWRSILPAWQSIIYPMIGKLNDKEAEKVVEIIAENYLSTHTTFDTREYNPFLSELNFAARLVANNEHLRTDQNEFVDTLIDFAINDIEPEALGLAESSYASKQLLDKIKKMSFNSENVPGTLIFSGNYVSFKSQDGHLMINGERDTIFERVADHYKEELIKIIYTANDLDSLIELINYMGESSKLKILNQYRIRDALANFPDYRKKAISILTKFVEQENLFESREAVMILGELKDYRCEDILVKCLESNGEKQSYLWKERKREAIEALAKMGVNHESAEEKGITSQRLGKEELPDLLNMYQSLTSLEDRVLVLKEIGRRKEKTATPFLIRELCDLAQIKDHRDDEYSIGKEIIDAMGKIRDSETLETMLDYGFSIPNPRLISDVATNIRLIGGSELLPKLKQYLLEGTPINKERAIRILNEVKADESFLDLIYPFLGHSDKTIASNAAGAIGRIGSKKAVPILTRYLEKPNYVVSIVHALGIINDPTSVDVLGRSLLNFSYELWKREKRLDPSQFIAFNLMNNAFNFNTFDPLKMAEIHALSEMDNPRAIPYLLEYFKKCPSYEKIEAAKVLAKFGCAEIMTLLRDGYSFNKGLGDYADISKTVQDIDITRCIRTIHENTKPQGYNPPQKRLAA